MVGTSETLQNPIAAAIAPVKGSTVVSDTFRAAQARSDAIEEQMAKDPASLRMLTGDRPTGALHIGHYFGSIRNRLRLQDSGAEIWQLIADYQVITDREVAGDIAGNVRNLLVDNIAAGLDPEQGDDLHALLGARAQPADAAVPQPGQRRRAAAQPHRQGRGQVGRHHLDRRAAAHLPRPPGRGHPVLQGQRRARRPRPAPPPRADPRRRAPLQRQVRPRVPRAGCAAVRGDR